jgi:hypothetical protein
MEYRLFAAFWNSCAGAVHLLLVRGLLRFETHRLKREAGQGVELLM